MPVTFEVRADDAAVKAQREMTARRVIAHFGLCLPDSRLLCFLDCEDSRIHRRDFGAANRGLYEPIHDNTPLGNWPHYVRDCIYVDDESPEPAPRAFDDLIYVHGSTCADEVGATMTLAHEFQHAIQHAKVRKLCAANSLIQNLKPKVWAALKLSWADIPIELEARIVSKRVAECFFGKQRVRHYIDKKIAEHINDAAVADWQFIRTLAPSRSVDLVDATQTIFERLRDHKTELEQALQAMRVHNPTDFADIDLREVFMPRALSRLHRNEREGGSGED